MLRERDRSVAIRLLALDLDGTLLTSEKTISQTTLAALRQALRAGITVVIATGRSPASARRFARQIDPAVSVISCNGAFIEAGSGEVLLERPVPSRALAEAADLLSQQGLATEVYGRNVIWIDKPWVQFRRLLQYAGTGKRGAGPVLRTALRLVRDWRANRIRPVPRLSAWLRRTNPVGLKLFALHPDPSRTVQAAEMLQNAHADLVVTSSGPGNVEVTAPGVSKGTALQWLGERLGIEPAEMAAAGDSPNDLEMLSFVGLPVAMGNAEASVKTRAKVVTSDNNHDGIAAFIEQHLLPGIDRQT